MTVIEIVFLSSGLALSSEGLFTQFTILTVSQKIIVHPEKISCTPLCAAYFYAIIRIPFLIF